MKKLILLLIITVSTGLLFPQTKIWEKSNASGNFPSFMSSTASTERGFAFGSIIQEPTSTIWEKSQANANFPSFMTTNNTERGFAFGTVNGNDRIYLVSRNGGTNVIILDAATGDSVGKLDMTGISGGTFLLNDAEVSSDGIIFGCNLTLNASTSAFKVYKWTSESAAPVEVINYTGLATRFGDKFTVTGSTADNSITIWAASPSSNQIVKFSTTDNGTTFTPTEITLSSGSLGNQPVVVPSNDGSTLYVNSASTLVTSYKPDGTFIDTLSGGIVSTYSDAMKYFEINGKQYLAIYNYGVGNENLRVVDVTNGLGSANLVDVTNSLGTVANGNGAGDVGVKINSDYTANLYMLSTNNGLAAYKLDPTKVGQVNHVYLVSRNGGTNVIILDAATGDSLGTLDMTGISGGTFLLNDAEVSSDGIIFACNLTTNSTTSDFKIYKWVSESSKPVIAVDYKDLPLRLGDKFTVTGSTSDNSIAIWAVGASSNSVIKFTTTDNGSTFTPSVITLSDGNVAGSPAVYPNNDGSEFYINSNGTPLKRYLANGTIEDTLSTGIVSTGSNALRYFEINSKKYIATFAYGSGNENARIVDITNGLKSASFIEATPSLGTASNGNGTGDVAMQPLNNGSINLYVLSTNNGLGAYNFVPPQQVASPTFSPIGGTYYDSVLVSLSSNTSGASIYYTLNGNNPTDSSTLYTSPIKITDTTTIKAVAYATGMTSSNISSATFNIVYPVNVNSISVLRSESQGGTYRLTSVSILSFQQSYRNQKFIQDTSGGILIDDNAGIIKTNYNVGDGISNIVGTLTVYGNMMEFVPVQDPGSAVSTGNKISPLVVTLKDLKNNYSKYESRLVTVDNVSFVDGNGSNTFANGTVYPITDGIDTVNFRTTFYDVDYINTIIPTGKLNISGLPNARSTGNYLTSRNLQDLGIKVAPAEQLYPVWAKTQASNNFPSYFSANNYDRGMAYGKVNGKNRVYVVARLFGPKIIIFDAATGDSVGTIYPNASVTGGTFPLNFVCVSADGVIFAANLTIDVSTSAFKVYRWNSETDTAVNVINYTDSNLKNGRVGDVFSVSGSASDNSLVIYAAVKGLNKIIKFTTTDNGYTFTPQVITLSTGNLGSIPNVTQAPDGSLWLKSYTNPLIHLKSDGTFIDSVSTSVIATDVTDIKYLNYQGKDYMMCYYPNDGVQTNEKFVIYDVTNPNSARAVYYSPSIGSNLNLNASGAVDYMQNSSGDYVFFILGTNNGLAAFTNSSNVVVSTLDTLFYGQTPILMKNPFGSGFVAGTNSYGDLGKYERFDFKPGDILMGFKYYFAYKKIVGTPDTIKMVVKTVASNGAPDSTLATLYTTSDQLDTTMQGNTFLLNNPITLKGPIFIGFEFLPTHNDTIAIYINQDGQGDNADRAWEMFSDSSYNDFGTKLNPSFSWNLNTDLWIAAYYKPGTILSVESNNKNIPHNFSLYQNYPNPFNPSTTIMFNLKVNGMVDLKIYNILGQQIAVLLNREMRSGTHEVNFNASNLASGVYFYRLHVRGSDGSQFNAVKKLMLLK